jgi:hypothetical protein
MRHACVGTLTYLLIFPLRTEISEPTDFVRYFRNPFIRLSTVLAGYVSLCLIKYLVVRQEYIWSTGGIVPCILYFCVRNKRVLAFVLLLNWLVWTWLRRETPQTIGNRTRFVKLVAIYCSTWSISLNVCNLCSHFWKNFWKRSCQSQLYFVIFCCILRMFRLLTKAIVRHIYKTLSERMPAHNVVNIFPQVI